MKETTLGEYLKTKIQAAGLTQDELSKKLGYKSGQFCSNWVRNVSVPPAKAVTPLATLLEIPREELANKVVEWQLISYSLDLKTKYGV